MAFSAQATQQNSDPASDDLSFLGKNLNEDLPVVIKKILKGFGFDNKFSISQINKDTIFVNESPEYSDSI